MVLGRGLRTETIKSKLKFPRDKVICSGLNQPPRLTTHLWCDRAVRVKYIFGVVKTRLNVSQTNSIGRAGRVREFLDEPLRGFV